MGLGNSRLVLFVLKLECGINELFQNWRKDAGVSTCFRCEALPFLKRIIGAFCARYYSGLTHGE